MVDRWAAASGADKEILFLASVAVRQIEIGLASILALLFGITVTTYGVALVSDRSFPKWLGWLAILGGIPIAVVGLAMAYTGFSDLGMTINLSGSSLALLWMLVVGVWMWHLVTQRVQTELWSDQSSTSLLSRVQEARAVPPPHCREPRRSGSKRFRSCSMRGHPCRPYEVRQYSRTFRSRGRT